MEIRGFVRTLLLVLMSLMPLGTCVGAESCPIGDLNGDCIVNFGDLWTLADQWLDPSGGPADLDGVNGVNEADFALLAGNWRQAGALPFISEFMATNDDTLPDEEGKFSDWIEIFNPTGTVIDLGGWHLTDDSNDLTKWAFPAGVELKPGAFLVVFASGENRRDPNGTLHTNFQLSAAGEYLALVAANGVTIAHEYAPRYPEQLVDVSYGLTQYSSKLVPAGATVSYRVPVAADAGMDWTDPGFDDSGWDTAETGLGFGFGGVARTAYNDCVYSDGQYIAENVTTYGIGSGFGGLTSGLLVDQATGDDMGIVATFNQNGGVNWQPDPGNGGRDSAAGTDAYNTFGGIADMTGVVYYGGTGWWVDLTFTGLNPATEYTFATSATRCNYDNRLTIYTLRGADAYANASTAGVDVLAENKVRFNTGDNCSEGYVTRWTGIRASDGSFTVRAEADPSSAEGYKAYSFDVFMLEGGYTASDIEAQMHGVNASLWARAEFNLEEGQTDIIERLTLKMKYEDGFVAYLNGHEVVRRNAPASVQWDSTATRDRAMEDATVFEEIDLMAFKGLLQAGGNVLAIHGLNDAAADPNFLILPELLAASNVGVAQYCTTATPGTFNVPGARGVVGKVWFSHDRGFYDIPFQLTLSSETDGAEIRYTTDGSRPTITHGTVYTAPITVYGTSTIRAVAVKPGYLDSRVDTHTYIFVSDVVRQSPSGQAPGPGWPTSSVNGQVLDYGMDPDVTNNATYRYIVDDALKSIPTISIVTDLANLFDSSRGIYVNAGGSGRNWERPASAELINPDGSEGFQINAGLRIRGGYSRGSWNPKHAFRLFFRAEYGQAKLRYPLFEDEGADEFDCVDLRTSQNYSWAHGGGGGRHNTMVREVFSRDVQGEMGHPYTRSRYYHLYLNGHYWGLFQTQERSEASFAESYLGGDKEDFDVVKTPGMNPTDGNRDALDRLYYETIAGFDNTERYYRAQGLNMDGTRNPDYERLLDVDNVIDFMIIEYYTGDRDGPASRYTGVPNNTYGIYNRVNPDGWKWFHHDNEHSLGAGSAELNMVTPFSTAGAQRQAFNPHWLHEQLMFSNPDYRVRFADRVYAAFFNDGVLTVGGARAHIQNRANQINMAIIAESARWGDASTHPPRTKDGDWIPEIDRLLYDTTDHRHLTTRVATVLGQFRSVGWYPDVQPPVFSKYGGLVPDGFSLHLGAPDGTIYYTVDGSDPRLSIAASSPGATVTLIRENAAKRVFVPTGEVASSKGTILAEYWFGIGGTAVSDLTSSADFPFYPDQTDHLTSFEMPTDWAENYGTRISGYLHPPRSGSYTFWVASDDGGELWLSTDDNPARKVLIANVPGWTSSRQWDKYPQQRSASISLSAGRKYYVEALQKEQGGGDNLAVAWQGPGISRNVIPGQYLSPAGVGWITPDFDDLSWRIGAGGVGYEREPGAAVNYADLIDLDVQADLYAKNSTCYVRIPFIVANTDLSDMTLDVRYDDGFIAYLNGAEILRLNFDADASPKWNSAAGSSRSDTSAVNFQSFDVSDHSGLLRKGSNVLAIHGLNRSASDPDFLISVKLTANEVGQGDISPRAVQYAQPITLTEATRVKARVWDGEWSPLSDVTFAVGPVAENLRVTEVMYHPQETGDPDDPNAEFVELENVGAETLNLNLVRFTNGIDFTFPSIELAPGGYVVIVKDRSVFEARYGTGVYVAGEYSGRLDNGGERITLEDAIGQTILDFRYRDGWHPITDGDGFSLTIVDPAHPDPNSWQDKDSWRPSALIGGSPDEGDEGLVPEPGSVVINEVLAHSHAGAPDWIELHNTTGNGVNIGGWFLSDSDADDASRMKYKIADGIVIGPYGYVVFYEDVHFGNPSDPCSLVPFALSENGEQVCLSSAQGDILTGYREVEDFGASPTGVSFGRYFKKSTGNYNFVAMSQITPGSTNAYPNVGPIVISEIMYNPESGNQNEEYIELCNISDSAVALYDYVTGVPWQLTDGIEFTFPDDPAAVIPASGYLLLVKDPAAFALKYSGAPSGVEILGPYDGRLDNGGERVELSMPGDVDTLGTRYYIRVDRVNYSDGSHPENCPGGVDLWPVAADGGGASLSRLSLPLYGNDPNNWTPADPPTPGRP
ncbi:MAG: lamin tail domain-containing protein [Phycisphaerales bacterium]|nr:MAG: lamin tail domain-containing protein [Phycisphaerales bacterium]